MTDTLTDKVKTFFLSEEKLDETPAEEKGSTKYFKKALSKESTRRKVPSIKNLSYKNKQKMCEEFGYDIMCYKEGKVLGGLSLQKHELFDTLKDWIVYEIDLKNREDRTKRGLHLMISLIEAARERKISGIKLPYSEKDIFNALEKYEENAKPEDKLNITTYSFTNLIRVHYK